MKIEDADVEWAIVDRWRSQLAGAQETEFEHTLSLSIASMILSWCSQRLNTPDGYQGKVPAGFFRKKNELKCISLKGAFGFEIQDYVDPKFDMPYWIDHYKRDNFRIEIPKDKNALEAIRTLRNGFCHSDARTVIPWNSEAGQPRLLLGFYIILTGWSSFTPWKKGTLESAIALRVSGSDLRLIGTKVADGFCKIMSEYVFQNEVSQMGTPGGKVLVEKAAA
jgi:hypothetical protein